ncbi:MAG: protein-disulfide reductase DsbD family protein [Alphaproteobacteria bacterium]|nr:protein-disulfide reductase DsbD family protein [Alphaproteobacteria bacterium]
MFRLLFLIFFLFPVQALALSSEWKQDNAASARLVSGVEAVGSGEIVPLGLEIKLAEGWHTYWRSPGQAGLPPTLEWQKEGASNLQSAKVLYPTPRRSTVFGLETIGYSDSVLFPIDAALLKKGKALNAAVSVDLILCRSICVPAHFDLSLAVPEGEAREGIEALLLKQGRRQLPSDSDGAGVFLKKVSSDGEGLLFLIKAHNGIVKPDIFIENDQHVEFSAPEVKIDSDGASAVLKVKPVSDIPEGVSLSALPLRLTILNDGKAAEIRTTGNSEMSPAAFLPEKPTFGVVLLLALLGGFILNFMPCVLPVLSLKIVGALKHLGGQKAHIRNSFFTTAGGIIFSFLVLATVMAVLKQFEIRLGWGVQFQQPGFLMFLIMLLVLFAANLWGFFELSLPAFLADRMNGKYRSGLAGDFVTGAFATLLATPCSAPFLGTAVGFALAAGTKEIFGTFAALGVGMALPYLAVALFPESAAALPRPGAWMLWLRRFLGGALALTAVWLIWIMSAQVGLYAALIFGGMMALLALFLAFNRRMSKALSMSGILLICGAAVGAVIGGEAGPSQKNEVGRLWEAYTPSTLNANLAEGKTVFLDVTADWCLTCKANKLVAFSSGDVVRRLFHGKVVAMQADWTNPDPVVSELLRKYGRYGIPFDVVYGPGAPQGIVLPELLTPGIVVEALENASKAD